MKIVVEPVLKTIRATVLVGGESECTEVQDRVFPRESWPPDIDRFTYRSFIECSVEDRGTTRILRTDWFECSPDYFPDGRLLTLAELKASPGIVDDQQDVIEFMEDHGHTLAVLTKGGRFAFYNNADIQPIVL